MIAGRNLLEAGRNSSPKEVFIQVFKVKRNLAVDLIKPLCRDRGIRFGFVNETVQRSTLPWDVNTFYV